MALFAQRNHKVPSTGPGGGQDSGGKPVKLSATDDAFMDGILPTFHTATLDRRNLPEGGASRSED